MSDFTVAIREIIYANKGEDDPSTLEGLHDIAMRAIFGEELNVLDDDYVDRFVTGFVLHYFNDEIGYETLPMWKIALKEKIYNNSELINKVYENLDKQIFSDYTVRKVSNNSSKVDNITKSLDSDTSTADAGTSSRVNGGTDEVAHTGTTGLTRGTVGTRTKGGADTDTLSGTDTTLRTGTSEVAKAGVNTDHTSGGDTTTQSGVDTAKKGGTVTANRDYDSTSSGDTASTTLGGDKITETSQNTRTESGSYTDTMSGSSEGSVDDNSVGINFDTPMGSLANLRTPDNTLRGEGVSAAASVPETGTHTGGGRTYNYMSAAQENDASRIEKGSESSTTSRTFNNYQIGDSASKTLDGTQSHVATSGSNNQATEGNDDTTTTYDTTDTMNRSATSKIERDSTNQSQFSSSDVRTDDLQDEVTHDTTRELTYGSTEESTGSESATNTYDETTTNTRNLREDGTTSHSGNISTDSEEVTAGEHAETSDVDDKTHHFNYEMFMKADIMMNKIWDIFDPIFFMIIDAF